MEIDRHNSLGMFLCSLNGLLSVFRHDSNVYGFIGLCGKSYGKVNTM